jgi:hypothetical protein
MSMDDLTFGFVMFCLLFVAAGCISIALGALDD